MSTAMKESSRSSGRDSAARFFVGGLVYILVTACASAISMLIWGR